MLSKIFTCRNNEIIKLLNVHVAFHYIHKLLEMLNCCNTATVKHFQTFAQFVGLSGHCAPKGEEKEREPE